MAAGTGKGGVLLGAHLKPAVDEPLIASTVARSRLEKLLLVPLLSS